MPNWKKEIRLSDLFRRGDRQTPASSGGRSGGPTRHDAESPGWGAPQPPAEPAHAAELPGAEPYAAPVPEASHGTAGDHDRSSVGAADRFRRRGRDGGFRPARGGLPDEPADAASSVWKRELKASELFRRRERAPRVPGDALTRPGEEPGVKFWKKELKLSDLVRAPQTDPAHGEDGATEPAEGRKRRSLGRPGATRDGGRQRSKDSIPTPAPIPLLRSVNLLPAEAVEETTRTFTPGLIAAAVAGVAVVAALAVTAMRESSTIGDLEAQKAQLEERIVVAQQQAVPRVTSPTGEPLVAEQANRVTALSEAIATRTAWDRVLRGAALVMPRGTWLKQITGSSQPLDPAAPAGATVAALTLVGYSLEQEGVAQLLGRLRTLPEVASVQLGAASRAEVGDADVYEFSLTLALRSNAAVAPTSAPGVPGLPTAPAPPAPAETSPAADQEQSP